MFSRADMTALEQDPKVPSEQDPMHAAGGAVTLNVERKYRQ